MFIEMSMMRYAGCLILILAVFCCAPPAFARIPLVKAPSLDAVYFIDGNGVRHVFPDRQTYVSWYGNDFSVVTTMSAEYIASVPLGENITLRPGSLAKIQSNPQVYFVEPGGILREIADEEVARALFGPSWMQLVRDVPESFWENYSAGEPIKYSHTIPDGVVYKIANESRQYFTWRGSLIPLEGSRAFSENNLGLVPVVVSDQARYSRAAPATGFDPNIFDPANELFGGGEDCEAQQLSVGVVLVSEGNATDEELVRARWIHKNLPGLWEGATSGLSTLKAPRPLLVIPKDGSLWFEEGASSRLSLNETAFRYYDENPDEIDFLLVLNNFLSFSDKHGEYVPVTNRLSGNGNILLRAGFQFGSKGKLKGVIHLGNINDHSFARGGGLNSTVNLILHEFGHAWSGRALFIDESSGQSVASLLRKDRAHWSDYVMFTSPLGSFGWRPLGGGAYENRSVSLAEEYVKGFSQLDMYFMGLYPASAILPVTYLVPREIDRVNNTITAEEKQVSMGQIIAAMGELRCER